VPPQWKQNGEEGTMASNLKVLIGQENGRW
jgi:hypothetical protein